MSAEELLKKIEERCSCYVICQCAHPKDVLIEELLSALTSIPEQTDYYVMKDIARAALKGKNYDEI